MIIDIRTARCSTCRYGSGCEEYACNYILITGKRRACSPIGCKKYERGERIQLPEVPGWLESDFNLNFIYEGGE